MQYIREVKHEVYGKRQTTKMKLLLSVFICLYSSIKIVVFAVNNKRHFSISFVLTIMPPIQYEKRSRIIFINTNETLSLNKDSLTKAIPRRSFIKS